MKEHPVHWSDLVYRVFLPSLHFVPFSQSTSVVPLIGTTEDVCRVDVIYPSYTYHGCS
nr:MAG TPA: hypothetical protein [Caudoviricetes sp.]